MISININNLSSNDIKSYLKQNAQIFNPPLNTKIDIDDYSIKISNFAIQFWATFNNKIVGFMACYFNDPKKEIGYITTISVVKKRQGQGVGNQLLYNAILYAKENDFKKINLEVNKENISAIQLYEKVGFIFSESNNENLLMTLPL
ncbi:MAG: GNAT family N-acetyltransferase [Prolixibacteraceae bacterium]|jgi:ribosomal protein S18 acetylase RimI-like enzyme|nr:GNAT family N-acetyltransferase [Prolixibacteraceae bacterium]MBT6006806.1 GNAT family N-acetyltransferase [Prolixibacteraceae bacterium]MBT6766929.1 GNAT family N-acetyltransferase [Prolixibacteraceae bacterium]MBT7000103.1 GNAT family N-acetyltransferase [Prolixibacteraceae bacterium]MBT7395758.1 GNAT family N-acetyltransferase [Prolixibacteraceae bacterium]